MLAFPRAMGEFGATLMDAGNIPGRTQTVPVAIYAALEAGNASLANTLVWLTSLVSLAALILFGRLRRLTVW